MEQLNFVCACARVSGLAREARKKEWKEICLNKRDEAGPRCWQRFGVSRQTAQRVLIYLCHVYTFHYFRQSNNVRIADKAISLFFFLSHRNPAELFFTNLDANSAPTTNFIFGNL